MTLTGENAIETGSSRGIGKAIAFELGRRVVNVAINDAGNEAKAQEVVEELQALGVQAIKIQANVSDESDVKKMMKEVIKTFGSIDILVNNAGVTRDGLLMRMKEEEFDE